MVSGTEITKKIKIMDILLEKQKDSMGNRTIPLPISMRRQKSGGRRATTANSSKTDQDNIDKN